MFKLFPRTFDVVDTAVVCLAVTAALVLLAVVAPGARATAIGIVMLLAPALVVLLAVSRRGGYAGLGALVVTVGVGSVLSADLELLSVAFPTAPVASATLSASHADATLTVPEDVHEIDLEIHGKLRGENALGQYALVLERGGQRTRITGELEQHGGTLGIRAGRRGVAARGIDRGPRDSVNTHEVELRGDGPVHAHLEHARGALAPKLDLLVLAVPRWTHAIAVALFAVAALAIGVDALLSLQGIKTQLAAGIGWVAAFALYLRLHFDPFSPIASLIRAAVIAAVIGAGAGAFLGWLSQRLLRRIAAS